jgi:hypothetical protein
LWFQVFFPKNLVSPLAYPSQLSTPLAGNRGPKMLCFSRLTSTCQGRKASGISVASNPYSGTITNPRDVFTYMHP